jgi:hypothetical protein
MALVLIPDATLGAVKASAELRRLRYLEALGVEVVVSRFDLPGARPSRRLGLRRADESIPYEEAPLSTARAGTPAGSDVRAELRRSLSKPATTGVASGAATRVSRSDSRVSPRVDRGDQFSLAAVISGGRLWLEDLSGEALALEQVQLMTAIGRALDHPQVDSQSPRVAQFDWPVLSNPQFDLGPDEAAAALRSFVLRQIEDFACSAVICCGESVHGRVAGAEFPVPVLHLPAMRGLLESPLQKRELWQQLRP